MENETRDTMDPKIKDLSYRIDEKEYFLGSTVLEDISESYLKKIRSPEEYSKNLAKTALEVPRNHGEQISVGFGLVSGVERLVIARTNGAETQIVYDGPHGNRQRETLLEVISADLLEGPIGVAQILEFWNQMGIQGKGPRTADGRTFVSVQEILDVYTLRDK